MSCVPIMHFSSLSQIPGVTRHSFSKETGFSSVSIDSRGVQEGALFVALAGTANDGHRFVEDAFKAGVCAALVEKAKLGQFNLLAIAQKMGKELFAADNTLHGFQEAARLYVEGFPNLIKIAITGSSGKTTTKEICAAIIGNEKVIVINQGNLNSETGLPLSVFQIRPHHQVGIFEMGMNRVGEIAELACALKPNIGAITNINFAHIGNIGSIEGIVEQKKQIFSSFTGKEIALIPEDEKYRNELACGVNGQVRFYGTKSFKELGDIHSLGLDGSQIVWAGERVNFPLPGKHNIANALAAIAIAKEIPCSDNAIRRGLESVRPLFGRSQILRGRVTVICDCYNANPQSLGEAVEFCDSLDWAGRKIYITGDMLELGSVSAAAHEQAGQLLAASGASMVFLFGKEMVGAVPVLEKAGWVNREGALSETLPRGFYHTANMDELSRYVNLHIKDGDLVLLKGSRGCALERLCETCAILKEAASVS